MVLNVHSLLGGGGGKGGRRGDMEVGKREIIYTYCYSTLSPLEMTPAFRWAVMRAILMVHKL